VESIHHILGKASGAVMKNSAEIFAAVSPRGLYNLICRRAV